MPTESRRPDRAEVQLAQLTGMTLDIPPRVRLVLGVAAITGLGLVVMQSLVGHQPGTIRVDKVIHFSGYAILAATFVLALRPTLFLPVLAVLLGIGFAIEYFQPMMGRERDLRDAAANTLGVAIGAGAGLFARSLYVWLRRDLALSAANHNRLRCRPGAIVLREGETLRFLYIIKMGEAKATRFVDGQERLIGMLGPGDVIGLLGLIQRAPQYATITAATSMTLDRLKFDELFETSDGHGPPVALVLQAAARIVRALADRTPGIDPEFEARNRRPGGQPAA